MHKPRRALVLGCGGVLGGAWTIAALESLERELGWDAREADLLIGTSVGAVLAALLGAGVPVSQMVASQLGTAPDCVWNHERDTGGIFPPLPRAKLIAPHWLTSRQPSKLSWFSAAVGLLPEGSADMSGFRRLINHAVPDGTWVKHPNTWMMAVDQDSGVWRLAKQARPHHRLPMQCVRLMPCRHGVHRCRLRVGVMSMVALRRPPQQTLCSAKRLMK